MLTNIMTQQRGLTASQTIRITEALHEATPKILEGLYQVKLCWFVGLLVCYGLKNKRKLYLTMSIC